MGADGAGRGFADGAGRGFADENHADGSGLERTKADKSRTGVAGRKPDES